MIKSAHVLSAEDELCKTHPEETGKKKTIVSIFVRYITIKTCLKWRAR
jgi:hypothetical protein